MESGPWATRRASRRRPSRARPAPTPRLPPRGAGPTPPAWVAPTGRDHRRGFDSRERPGRCCGRASRRARRATETAETPRRRQPRTAETPRRRTLRERPRSPGRRPGRTLACRRARAAPRPSRLRSRYLLDIPSHPLRSSPATARPLPKRGSHAQPPSRGRVATLWRNELKWQPQWQDCSLSLANWLEIPGNFLSSCVCHTVWPLALSLSNSTQHKGYPSSSTRPRSTATPSRRSAASSRRRAAGAARSCSRAFEA